MYKSIYFDRRSEIIHLWDDETGYEKIQFQKYAYLVDKDGPFLTMDGIRVKRVDNWPKQAEERGLVYEHDVNPTTRFLVDRYYESEEIASGHVLMYFDIEVAKEGRYSTAKSASNTITSISYFTQKTGYVCLLIDKRNGILKDSYEVEGNEVKVRTFPNEKMLLMAFLGDFCKIRPTILTGWNIDNFDVPYIVNRMNSELGRSVTNRLSEIGIVDIRDIDKRNQKITIAGVNCLDYLPLYKKFTEGDRPRFTLDYISKLELGRGKVEYEGSLDLLYETDIEKFIRYTIVDVELCVSLDKKFDFITSAMGLCHAGRVPYEHIYFPTFYFEGASLAYCKQKGIVAMTTHSDEPHTKAKGAFVRKPSVGIFKYAGSFDLQSQYPLSIISQNVSPETKYGRVLDWNKEDFARDVQRTYIIQPKKNRIVDVLGLADDSEFTTQNLRNWLTENQMCISAIGVIYRIDKIGLIPSILDRWFNKRKEYKALAAEYRNTDPDKYAFYDRKQYIQKILLNSFYGAMLEPNFRFYDKENGESTTQTGFNLIQYTSNVINMYCSKITGDDRNYVIYNDTDSAYAELLPLIGTAQLDEEELIGKMIQHANQLEKILNLSYEKYALKYHNLLTHRWVIKQEKIAKRAFWGSAKKRYAMRVIVDEGKRVDKIVVKGFDMVKSNFPQSFRIFMEELIKEILYDSDRIKLNERISQFKNSFKDQSVLDILPPTSVNEISKYQSAIKSIPIAVSAALNYNRLLGLLNLSEEYPSIEDGDKVMWGYLRQNPYNFNTIAIRGEEDPTELLDFIGKYVDRPKILEHLLESKLQTIWDDLGWGSILIREKVESDFF